MLRAYVKSDIGLVRKTNEDSYVFLPPEIFAVADGMGGHEAGEIASSLAVTTLKEFFRHHKETLSPDVLIRQAIVRANQVIYQMAQQKPECAGMGTTLTAVYLQEDTVFWGHVGDSRLYHQSNSDFQQITQDHSLVWELLQRGTISAEEAHVHPHRNILTRAVGTTEEIQVDSGSFSWQNGDRLLICSDGLTTMLTDKEIAAALAENKENQDRVTENLVDSANAAGGMDNITAILLLNMD